MANIITIKEEKNSLKIVGDYEPMVCGNSNYLMQFEFDEEWQQCQKKVAIFLVEGKRISVQFDGNMLSVPVLPNAIFALLVLTTADNPENQFVTSSLRLELQPTPMLDSMAEFDPVKTYLPKLLGAINKIENGEVSVLKAEVANFANNVCNPNLLINGDFKVNQRGETVYNLSSSKYTVDRWMGFAGLKATTKEIGINIENTSTTGGWFQQKLEEKYSNFADKDITISAKINGKIFSVSGHLPKEEPKNQIDLIRVDVGNNGGIREDALRLTYIKGILSVNIYIYANAKMDIDYIKLEYGKMATAFQPRTYAEELSLCQRYYEKIDTRNISNKYQIYAIANSNYRLFQQQIYFGVEKRIPPTICLFSSKDDEEGMLYNNSKKVNQKFSIGYNTSKSFQIGNTTGNMTLNDTIMGYFYADAEIY